MKFPAFEYVSPQSIPEAIRLLSESDNAKIMSGGQSLMPILAFRLAAPSLIVDIGKIPDLNHIEIEEGGVKLGARVRWVDIEKNSRLPVAHPLLAEAIRHVAHYQIRNRGTVGGSVSHADPAAEMPGVCITCDAEMEIIGPQATRRVPSAKFFQGSLETALGENEILLAVHLPAWRPERKWAFKEFARRRGDFAVAGVLIFYDEDAGGTIFNAHVGAIGVADRPQRLGPVEAALNGNVYSRAMVDHALATANETLEPATDIHVTGDYRRELYCTLLDRALHEAHHRAAV